MVVVFAFMAIVGYVIITQWTFMLSVPPPVAVPKPSTEQTQAATYLPLWELIVMNQVATVGAWIVGASYMLFIYNLVKSSMFGKPANTIDPFGMGTGVEYYYDFARREPHH
jgi:heme/copper-type cytochrome/quinol oxidase subunit 1